MLTHHNITSNAVQILWMMKPLEVGMKGKSSTLTCVPLFHQFGHIIVHISIYWGLRMFLTDPRDTDKIVEIIKKYRPFMVVGVPTHYMLLLPKDLPRMPIFLYSGAAALPPEVAEKIEKKIGVPMGEGYGMTEATATTHLNLSALSKVTGFMTKVKRSIGVPTPDTEVKIVNLETGEEVPFGETGELYIRGPQVMQGYWPTPGKGLRDGWLATGDIGRMDEDGYFYILDRIKDMINVSGMKVYSRVVDDVLFEHPAVRLAGVIGTPDPERPGSERVKAFVTLKEDYEGKITGEDIIKYCSEKLPPYAVPKSVEFRKDLPLTLAMKIFKRKLREEEIAKMKEKGEIAG
jgi:long-chain acyl-CoA synthetase